jgi:hypothetical protein
MSTNNDRDSFLQALFTVSKDKHRETVVVPWKGETAMISARRGYGNVSLDMGIFELAITEAGKLVDMAANDSISLVDIPPLIASDLDKEGSTLDVAPFLYVIWAAGDAAPFFEYFAMSGDYFSHTGIVDAILVAEDEEPTEQDHLEVDPEDFREWIDSLARSGNSRVAAFAAYLSERQEYFGSGTSRFDDHGNIREEFLDDYEMFDGMR